MKEQKQDPETSHHILPRSKGGKNSKNIKQVPNSYHEAYHKLFQNMTPCEIIIYLEKMWFTTRPFVPPQKWI